MIFNITLWSILLWSTTHASYKSGDEVSHITLMISQSNKSEVDKIIRSPYLL